MKVQSFIKRLNATELGLVATNDTFVAIPKEVDLSDMLENQKAMDISDRATGMNYTSENSNIKYVQTGQNGQERISGLGQYYAAVDAKVGDEILIERIDDRHGHRYLLDFYHRNAIVFQKYPDGVEILPNDYIAKYAIGDDYQMEVQFGGRMCQLDVKFVKKKKKKVISPNETKFYDLIINGNSILPNYSYQEYIEILTDGMRLGRMKTYLHSIVEMMEDKDE